ncbi:MAG TPA: alpha/beta fold hydrolase [Candidatus Baltobacteraceae bacterium]|nr:alpha/beta fold hydrolase [Candidatus Baltobacteraceae bacterium]
MRTLRVILALFFSISSLPAAAAQPALGLHLRPCALGKAKMPARCGTFGVYEDRLARSGKIIALNLIVIPAKHPSHHAAAEIGGGPGEAATDFAVPIADGEFFPRTLALHDAYDLIFMDDRGMGKSNPFACNFVPANDPASYFRYLFPPKLVADCRTKSAATHAVPLYNTNASTDDLDDIRAALGYDKILLDGGSYGTLFSLVYMRRHPEHVESAILDGVAPPGFQPLPGEPLGAQTALDDLIAKCSGNGACRAHFPLLAAHIHALLRRFDAGPLMVPAKNFATKRTQTVALSKEVFVDSLRHILYNPFAASYVPYVVERAYVRDYVPLARVMQTVIVGFGTDLNDGAFLSYSCADMMPFISEQQLKDAAARSFTGDLRIRAQQEACRQWNVPAMPPAFNEPVRSDAPVLMILGSDDPATPAKYGQEALRYLPNGRAVLVTGGGHGADTPCTDALVEEFVKTGSAKGLDLNKCSATFKLPPFATSMKGWPSD